MDVLNADETVFFFFQCLLDRTATFMDVDSRWGKKSKVHVTLLLAANEDDYEKLFPLMIGLFKKPTCFSKIIFICI